ncbi:MAG: DUF6159 family protein [Planctomycetota bacterium]|jgi:hypothetical protein
MGTLGTTWALMKASWDVVRNNKRLLILPVLSAICLVLVLASFLAPVVGANWAVITGEEPLILESEAPAPDGSVPGEAEGAAGEAADEDEGELNLTLGIWEPPTEDSPTSDKVRFGLVLFGFYFANYFVIVFFNAAIVASALFWMRDGEASLSRGLGAAAKRLPQVVGWALIAATVGLLLKLLESNRKGSRFLAAILGTAWTVMTYLAVPVLVVEGKGPVGALKESVSLLRKSWGQQLVGSFGFGIFWFLLSLVGFAILGVGGYLANATGNAGAMAIAVVLAVVYFIGLILVSSVMTPVFQAALYVYAKEGTAPGSFGEGLLKGAFHPKE